MVRLVKHGMEEFRFESERQLDHEMVDRFFMVVVVKVVLERRHWKGYYVYQEWLRCGEMAKHGLDRRRCKRWFGWKRKYQLKTIGSGYQQKDRKPSKMTKWPWNGKDVP
ncbi:hypothetical protein Tco_1325603 [Tanacetum coccineum]